VLVGHGYGGTVITQAGNHQGVAALVYVAAYAPDVGESTADVEKDHLSPSFIARFEVDASGYLYLPPDAVLEFLRTTCQHGRLGPRRRTATYFEPAHSSIE